MTGPSLNDALMRFITGPRMRVFRGRVVEIVGDTIKVQLGDNTEIVRAYRHIGVLAVGDYVDVVQSGNRGYILGVLDPPQPGVIANGSFEQADAGAQPRHWLTYHVSTPALVDVLATQTRDGQRALRVTSTASGGTPGIDSYVYSTPVGVAPDQSYALRGWAQGPAGSTQTMDAYLGAMWFATVEDRYPTVVAANSTAASVIPVPNGEWTPLAGFVTVPAGATGMSVFLRTVSSTGESGSVFWDTVDGIQT